MAKSKRQLSDVERAERRRRDRERLQAAAGQLLTSEGWQRWVRLRSQAGLARLSLSNQLLVALARRDATFVAGFKTWLRLGFAVKKGRARDCDHRPAARQGARPRQRRGDRRNARAVQDHVRVRSGSGRANRRCRADTMSS
ncbi:MAG: hypothetical protein ACR2MB_14790 [Acidimicrobiales bacterium]